MKPILTILTSVFILLVVFSVVSIQVTLTVQRRWKVVEKRLIVPTRPPSGWPCVASRQRVQELSNMLNQNLPIIDLGANIGEVSLPLVKRGFTVYSIDTQYKLRQLARLRAKLSPRQQERWILGEYFPKEFILLRHNHVNGIDIPLNGLNRDYKVCA